LKNYLSIIKLNFSQQQVGFSKNMFLNKDEIADRLEQERNKQQDSDHSSDLDFLIKDPF
jgi:hypothetical protein